MQAATVLSDHAPYEMLGGVHLIPGGLPSASAAPSSIFRAALIILSYMPSHLLRTSSGTVLVSESAAAWTSSAQDTQALARHEQRPQLVDSAPRSLGMDVPSASVSSSLPSPRLLLWSFFLLRTSSTLSVREVSSVGAHTLEAVRCGQKLA